MMRHDAASYARKKGGDRDMIQVTRLNGDKLIINADMIEFVEALPDTIITTTTGKKLNVTESSGDIVDRIIEYKRRIHLIPDLYKKQED